MCGRPVMSLVLLSAVVLLCGCPSPSGPRATPGDPGKVEALVYSTGQVWNVKEDFDKLFAAGATLSDQDRNKFQGTSVIPQLETVQIDGDTATVQVEVTTYPNNEPQSKTVTWEARKEGDAWKLTKAPLR